MQKRKREVMKVVSLVKHEGTTTKCIKSSQTKDTVSTINIRTPQLLTILVLKFERTIYYPMLCLKNAG